MHKRSSFANDCVTAALGLILPFVSSYAGADSNDDALRLLREQQQQLEQLRRQEQAQPRGEAPSLAPMPVPEVALPAERCLPVQRLHWQGQAPLATDIRSDLEQKYTQRCLNEAALNALLREANLALLREGFITSRVLLRDDAYQDGALTLSLIQGRIATIQAEGLSSAEVAMAFPEMRAGVFNLHDLEQGLDQLNRLAANQVRAELRPGTGLGESELWLSNSPARRWHGFVGLDNGGSPSTGRAVLSASVGLDNLIGSADFWSLALRRSFSGDSDALSQGLSLYASQPWGYWTGSASLALAESKVPLRLPSLTLQSRTTTTMPALRVDRVLHRDANSIWRAQASLARRETDSRIEDEKLDISSPTNSSAELALQYDALSPLPWGARLGVSRGLAWFAADRDSTETKAAGLPRAQFEKWRLDLHARYATERWSYSAEAAGQYSPHRLPGAEELVMGDASSVRGFQEAVVSARRGWFLRQTVTHFLSSKVQPYIGLDGGRGLTAEGADWLGSLSLGLRCHAWAQTLDLSFSRAWRQEGESPLPRLQMRYGVSF